MTVSGVNPVSPTYYRFEALLSNLVNSPAQGAAPALFFEINVNGAGWKNFTRSESTPWGSWGTNYVDTYFPTAPTSLGFRLRNFETAYNGNDFALDNIYFGLTTSSPSYGDGFTTIKSAGAITNPTYISGDVNYWAPGAGAGGSGTWNVGSNAFWSPSADGSGTKQAWSNGNYNSVAVFGGTAGTVTASGTVQSNQLSFTTSGYTLAGGAGAQIDFIGLNPAIQLASGVSTTINANLGGSGVLAITGTGVRGTATLGGAVTTTAGVSVTNAALSLSGAVQRDVLLAESAVLGGSGRVYGTVYGYGTVAPGNSPGILTADSIDPSDGMDFTFEFSGTAPNYASGTASVNDVLRLTGGTPFLSGLTNANTKTLFLDMTKEELGLGVMLKAAFFTDADSDFLSLINNATWDNAGFAVYVKGDGNGTDNSYNGQGYYNWRNPAMFGWTQSLFASTSVETANFAGAPETGRVLTLVVSVPEPSTHVMALGGLACGGFLMRRRRKRA